MTTRKWLSFFDDRFPLLPEVVERLEQVEVDDMVGVGMSVRVDRRTGIAYTYAWGDLIEPDELSPWRRGVVR